MSCWATARANVELDADQGVRLLTDEQVVETAKILFKTMGLTASVAVYGSTTYVNAGGYSVRIWQGAGRQIAVGHTSTELPQAKNQEVADKFSADLKAALKKVGGLRLQQVVMEKFSKMGTVEQTQTTPTGAVVLTINL